MKRAFISYRRQETEGQAQSLCLRLKMRFSNEQIFMDVDDIKPTQDFVEVLQSNLNDCAVLVVLIGRNWLTIPDSLGKPRLDNPEDFVRIEVATALERGIPVLPVLVQGAEMPRSNQLPSNLKALARRQAVIMSGPSYEYGMNKVVATIEEQFGVEPFTTAHSPPPKKPATPWYKNKILTYTSLVLAILFFIGLTLDDTTISEVNYSTQQTQPTIHTNREDFTKVGKLLNSQQPNGYGLAKVMDPPSNIRQYPNGPIICQATSSSILNIYLEPELGDSGSKWYQTNFCGPNRIGVIHISQIRLR